MTVGLRRVGVAVQQPPASCEDLGRQAEQRLLRSGPPSRINDHHIAIGWLAVARRDPLIANAMERSVRVIVRGELVERAPQMFRAEQGQLAPAFSLDGLHPAFRECIHVGCLNRSAHNLHAIVLKDAAELPGE